MIKIVKEIYEDITNPVRFFYNTMDNKVLCEKCKSVLQFEENDIDRSKILPHINCPCGEVIQLSSKYYKKEKFFKCGLNMIFYSDSDFDQEDILDLFKDINYIYMDTFHEDCFKTILNSNDNIFIINMNDDKLYPKMITYILSNNLSNISELNSDDSGKIIIFLNKVNKSIQSKSDFLFPFVNNCSKCIIYSCRSILSVIKSSGENKYLVEKHRELKIGTTIDKDDII